MNWLEKSLKAILLKNRWNHNLAWHLSWSILALLENVAMTTLSLITWRVPLGNRFWSTSVFSLSKRGAKLKSDLPKSKSLVFCLLGFRLSVFNSSFCATYSSPPKKIETLILTRFLRQLVNVITGRRQNLIIIWRNTSMAFFFLKLWRDQSSAGLGTLPLRKLSVISVT
jgi:hypothetical protein